MTTDIPDNAEAKPNHDNLPPLTNQALEIATEAAELPADWDYREELTNILEEKYGYKKN